MESSAFTKTRIDNIAYYSMYTAAIMMHGLYHLYFLTYILYLTFTNKVYSSWLLLFVCYWITTGYNL